MRIAEPHDLIGGNLGLIAVWIERIEESGS